MKRVTVSIRVSEEEHSWLARRARESGRSINQEVLRILRRVMESVAQLTPVEGTPVVELAGVGTASRVFGAVTISEEVADVKGI